MRCEYCALSAPCFATHTEGILSLVFRSSPLTLGRSSCLGPSARTEGAAARC